MFSQFILYKLTQKRTCPGSKNKTGPNFQRLCSVCCVYLDSTRSKEHDTLFGDERYEGHIWCLSFIIQGVITLRQRRCCVTSWVTDANEIMNCVWEFYSSGERETDGGHDFRPRTTLRFFWAEDRTNFPTVDKKIWETCFLQAREGKSASLYLLLLTKMLNVLGVSINHVDLVTLKNVNR